MPSLYFVCSFVVSFNGVPTGSLNINCNTFVMNFAAKGKLLIAEPASRGNDGSPELTFLDLIPLNHRFSTKLSLRNPRLWRHRF